MNFGRVRTFLAGCAALMVLTLLVLVVLDPFGPVGGRGSFASQAIQTALALSVIAIVVLSIKSIVLRGRSWLANLVLVIGLALALTPTIVWTFFSPGLASTLFQGLGVTSAGPTFGDLEYVLRALECVRSGSDILDPVNSCFPGGTLYGPALSWMGWLSVPPPWAFGGGLVLAVLAVVAVWLLARRAPTAAVLALLLTLVSPAWILLIERGNLDSVVVIVAVCLALGWNRIGPLLRGPLVVAIAVLAAVKYYPILLILGTVPFLRTRRQLVVPLALGLAFVSYLALFRSDVGWSLEVNSGQATTSNGSIGSRVIGAMAGATSIDAVLPMILILVGTLALVLVVLGALANNSVTPVPAYALSSALTGSSLTFATLVVAGAGFPYKAVFLLLTLPFSAYWMKSQCASQRRVGMLMILTTLVAQTLVLNALTASFAALIASSLALGAAISQTSSQSGHKVPWISTSESGKSAPLESSSSER